MRIEIVPCLADNYAYLVVTASGEAVVVDPSEAQPVIAALEATGLSLVGIWLTHHHHDHVGGIEQLVQTYPRLSVVAGEYDAQHGRIPCQTRSIAEDEPLWLGSRRARVLTVPGHTLGAIAYLIEGALFSGDTLFSAGCGRLFEGTPQQMQHSLSKLRTLDGATLLYPGHEYAAKNLAFASELEPENAAIAARRAEVTALRAEHKPSVPTSLADEWEINPFLRWDEPTVIARARALGAPSDDAVDVFAAVRTARNGF